jgi:hypothetical protein
MRTLPVFDTFGHAIKSTANNIRFAFHVSWPWLAVLLPVNIVSNLYITARHDMASASIETDVATVSFLVGAMEMVAFASIAVNWHRYILRDEVPAGLQRLRLDREVWRYFGNILLIGLTVIAILIPAYLLFFALQHVGGPAGSLAGNIALLGALIFAVVTFYRLSVKLPGIAVGRTDYRMADAWKDTEGNFWRIFGLVMLFVLVVAIATLIIFAAGYLLGMNGGALGASFGIAIQVVIGWVVQILGVTMLTSLYGYLVEGRNF